MYVCMARWMVTGLLITNMLFFSSDLDPPDLQSSFFDMIKNESDTLKLHCNFTGTPSPTISWYRNTTSSNGFQLIKSSRAEISDQKSNERRISDSTLQVFDVVKEDEGTYRCLGANNVGNFIYAVNSSEAFITIHGKCLFVFLSIYASSIHLFLPFIYSSIYSFILLIVPPTIYPNHREYIVVGVKDYDFSFGFVIEFDFPPVKLNNIQWHFTNLLKQTVDLLANNSRDPRHTFSDDLRSLMIKNVSLNDRGNYTLTATNEAGIRSSTVYLEVHGKKNLFVIKVVRYLRASVKYPSSFSCCSMIS